MKNKHHTPSPTTNSAEELHDGDYIPQRPHEEDDYYWYVDKDHHGSLPTEQNEGVLDVYGTDYYFEGDDYNHHELAHNTSQAYHDCMAKGSSKVAVTLDDWTLDGSTPPNCTFPFTYKRKVYYACTDIDRAGKFWCANSCDFSLGQILHRGECDIPKNTKGVLGTGIGLSALNIFVALLLTVAIIVALLLCLVEYRKYGSPSKSSQTQDEGLPLNEEETSVKA
jgi:hypothetical protein